MKIDTHQHFWKLDRGDYGWLTREVGAIYRDFLPSDLKPLLDEAGFDGTIAVQAAASEAETEFLLSLARQHAWILGVVGWVDLSAETAPSSIERLADDTHLVGLRPMIQDSPNDAWMLQDALRPSIASMVEFDLTFDALVLPRHLGYLADFIARYPDLRVVVDHCAKPEIRNGAYDDWARDIARIAETERVYCKLSGLVTEAAPAWRPADLRPYIRHILNVFGPDRVVFGSDWPVLNLAGDYATWHRIAADELASAGMRPDDLPVRTVYPRLKLR